MAETADQHGPGEPGFRIVRRGYDRAQVDALLQGLAEGRDVENLGFDVVRRGYDKREVDAYLAALGAGRGDGIV